MRPANHSAVISDFACYRRGMANRLSFFLQSAPSAETIYEPAHLVTARGQAHLVTTADKLIFSPPSIGDPPSPSIHHSQSGYHWNTGLQWPPTATQTLSIYYSGFQLGDMSSSGDISDFGGRHNTICCHEKSKHFCDPIVSLFSKSSSVQVCLFVLFLPLIYFLLNWPEDNENLLICLDPRQGDMGCGWDPLWGTRVETSWKPLGVFQLFFIF